MVYSTSNPKFRVWWFSGLGSGFYRDITGGALSGFCGDSSGWFLGYLGELQQNFCFAAHSFKSFSIDQPTDSNDIERSMLLGCAQGLGFGVSPGS